MERVQIHFRNIECHENTQFDLRPGMNFILADDNNVGKSTIFKLLKFVAKAPNISPSKVDGIVRWGCDRAYAVFEYSNQRVTVWFQRERGASTKMFFEHLDTDQNLTRSVSAPRSLLDALGIVVGEDGEILNMNDADSVQLIAKSSTTADGVLTRVLLDPRIESVKHNINLLSKDVMSDYRVFNSQKESITRIASTLTYTPNVESFNYDLPHLRSACKIADMRQLNLPAFRVLPADSEIELLRKIFKLCYNLKDYCEHEYTCHSTLSDADYQCMQSALRVVKSVDMKRLSVIDSEVLNEEEVGAWSHDYDLCSTVLRTLHSLEKVRKLDKTIEDKLVQKKELRENISEVSDTVMCPVRGKVWYDGEKCIPCTD